MLGAVLTILFVALAVLHIVPAVAAVRPQRLAVLYGVRSDDAVLLTLLQHRAVLLGIVGLLMLAGAVHAELRWFCLVFGVLSMASFLVIAHQRGTQTGPLVTIYRADQAGMVVAAATAVLMLMFGTGG